MDQVHIRRRLLVLLTPLAVLLLLFLLPPERTLGEVIKLVLLHGALVRAALIAFAMAGGGWVSSVSLATIHPGCAG